MASQWFMIDTNLMIDPVFVIWGPVHACPSQELLWKATSCFHQLYVPRYTGLLTRLLSWEPGFEPHHCPALLSFSKTIYPLCCSWPRSNIGDPVSTIFFHRGRAFPRKRRNRSTNKLPIQIHWVEKLKVPFKWWILSWRHIPNELWCAM